MIEILDFVLVILGHTILSPNWISWASFSLNDKSSKTINLCSGVVLIFNPFLNVTDCRLPPESFHAWEISFFSIFPVDLLKEKIFIPLPLTSYTFLNLLFSTHFPVLLASSYNLSASNKFPSVRCNLESLLMHFPWNRNLS